MTVSCYSIKRAFVSVRTGRVPVLVWIYSIPTTVALVLGMGWLVGALPLAGQDYYWIFMGIATGIVLVVAVARRLVRRPTITKR